MDARSAKDLFDAPELRHFKDDMSHDAILPNQVPSISCQTSVVSVAGGLHDSPSFLVKLSVDAAPGCGGVAWPAGFVSHCLSVFAFVDLPYWALIVCVLANYLLQRITLTGLTVVELGSGTGLVGIVAGLMRAEKVWITDQEPLLGLMGANISLNGLTANVNVSRLDWGSPLPQSIPTEPDLVLAADCVYLESAFGLLVSTLSALATSPKTEIIFCYKRRRKADKRFFTLLKKEFRWNNVMDDPRREEYNREGIFLYRLVKK